MNKCIRVLAATSAVAISLLLTGCGPHPSSGSWVSEASSVSDSVYSSVKLELDGTGSVYPNTDIAGQENSKGLRCVWQAKSANAADLECRGDTDTSIRFEFVVAEGGDESQAELIKDGKQVARLIRG